MLIVESTASASRLETRDRSPPPPLIFASPARKPAEGISQQKILVARRARHTFLQMVQRAKLASHITYVCGTSLHDMLLHNDNTILSL